MLKHLLERRNTLDISAMENPDNPITGAMMGDISPVESGVRVTTDSALRQTAVFACLRLIASTASTFPIHVLRREDDRRVMHQTESNAVLWRKPNPVMTRQTFWETAFLHCVGTGNSYNYKVRNGLGTVTQLWPLLPSRVRVTLIDGGKVYEYTRDDGAKVPLTDRDVLHVPGMSFDGVVGLNPISYAREAIGLGMAAERFGARFFGSGSTLAGILKTDAALDQDQANRLKQRWNEMHQGLSKSHDIGVLDNGAEYQQVGINPEDAQFLDTRQFQVAEIARLFGVPPHMIGDVERSTSWGSGIEQQQIGFVQYTMRHWLERFEQAIDMHLLQGGQYVQFNVDGLLRGDTNSRHTAYARAHGRWMTVNEIRSLEDLPPVDGGDELMQPLNMESMGESEPIDDEGLDDDSDTE